MVSKYGDMTDVHLFSDISMNLTIEMVEYKIEKLHDERIRPMTFHQPLQMDSMSGKTRTIYLNVTFSKGTGPSSIEAPAVPGKND